jgi:hypothetical protein
MMAISADNRNARRSLIITEHDPLLREDATSMMDLVSQPMGALTRMLQSCFAYQELIPFLWI